MVLGCCGAGKSTFSRALHSVSGLELIHLDQHYWKPDWEETNEAEWENIVRKLDADLAERDGAEHAFYARYNKIDKIRHALVAYIDSRPVGCGAMKAFAPGIMEIKRMYTLPEARGKGVATCVLAELEHWAGELSCKKCVLETGKRQPEAILLYQKNGYLIIPDYGQYIGVENSLCFEKLISSNA